MDFTNIPNGFAQWGVCMAFFIGSVLWTLNQGAKLMKAWRGKAPDPPNEQLQAGAMELLRRISHIEKKGEAAELLAAINHKDLTEKIEKVKDQIREDTRVLTKEMNDKFEAQTKELNSKFEKLLDGLPDKVLNLLRNFVNK